MGGGDKCLLPLGGRPLLGHAIERLTPQVDSMVLSANGDPDRFAAFGLPVVADPVPGSAGPLAGILGAMRWARRHRPDVRQVVSVATDTPFFPHDLVARLSAVAGKDTIAIARSGGREHRVFGIFPVACGDALERFLTTAASPKVGDWLTTASFAIADFDVPPPPGIDPFFNVNTPEDLALAESALIANRLRPAQD